MEASVTGLEPRKPHVLALVLHADGSGPREPLSEFVTNAAGAAIVNSVGPIRQIVTGETNNQRRYLAVFVGTPSNPGHAVQIQVSD